VYLCRTSISHHMCACVCACVYGIFFVCGCSGVRLRVWCLRGCELCVCLCVCRLWQNDNFVDDAMIISFSLIARALSLPRGTMAVRKQPRKRWIPGLVTAAIPGVSLKIFIKKNKCKQLKIASNWKTWLPYINLFHCDFAIKYFLLKISWVSKWSCARYYHHWLTGYHLTYKDLPTKQPSDRHRAQSGVQVACLPAAYLCHMYPYPLLYLFLSKLHTHM